MSLKVNVSYKDQAYALIFSDKLSPSVADLQAQIESFMGVQKDAQRLFQKRHRIDCSDPSRLLRDVCDTTMSLRLMTGASMKQIEEMEASHRVMQRNNTIRETRRVVNIAKRNEKTQARDALSTNYRFHAIEPLNHFAEKEKAQEILEKLANDRGILAVMAKHKWSVGVLAEMPPDGKVGVDPVCVMGLNQNMGQKILLRLRTDDLLGFRKYLSIKKVLFHELSHNVYSVHNNQFYQLMRQVEKECNELDWTNGGGATVGELSLISPQNNFYRSGLSGNRLGGGTLPSSRLLRIAPIEPRAQEEALYLSPNLDELLAKEVSAIASRTEPADKGWTVKDSKAKDVDNARPQPANTSHASRVLPQTQVETADIELATLTMSGREKRIYDAVNHLQSHYSTALIEKAASLLYQIVSNIITHPTDEKFRSIRKANRLFDGQVAKFPECLEFLLALGFEDQLDKFVLVREDPALLWIGRSTLESLLSAEA